MLSSNLLRYAGLANVVSGILLALGLALHPPAVPASVTTSAWVIVHTVLVIALIFAIAGLFGLYGGHAGRLSPMGTAGFLLVFVAVALYIGITYFEAFVDPWIASIAPEVTEARFAHDAQNALSVVLPIMGISLSLGWVLLGIGLWQANQLPRAAILLAVLGALPTGLEPFFPVLVLQLAAIAYGVGIAWMGWAMLGQPGRVPAAAPA
jgi:hypothetical protein